MAVQNNLVKQEQQRLSFNNFMLRDAARDQINKMLGKDGQKFITSIVSAVNANPELQKCTNESILSAAMLGAGLKLSPSPQLGNYYMVPFNDKNKGKVAQFVLGYKGYIQLAIRSGEYRKLNVLAVKEGELIRFIDQYAVMLAQAMSMMPVFFAMALRFPSKDYFSLDSNKKER